MACILAIGAHPDDVELGCAGTLACRKQDTRPGPWVGAVVVTNGEAQLGLAGDDWKRRAIEAKSAAGVLGVDEVRFLGYEERSVCYSDHGLVGKIREVLDSINPAVVYCHSEKDIHQTHVAVARATLAACRLSNVPEVYSFEVPSTTAQFAPTYYHDITHTLQDKLKAIACFETQKDRYYMLDEAVTGLARHRAYQARLPQISAEELRAAEAFEVERMVLR